MPEQPRVVIAGASGFIGLLIRSFARDGYDVRTIGRSGADASWQDPSAIAALVDGADVLVNLAESR
jgi:uncharacterized protein YbjT (DUF2867 family)